MLNYVPYFKAMVGSKLSNEEGQGMVEYALIIGLIAIALVVALGVLQVDISDIFERIGTALDGAAN